MIILIKILQMNQVQKKKVGIYILMNVDLVNKKLIHLQSHKFNSYNQL